MTVVDQVILNFTNPYFLGFSVLFYLLYKIVMRSFDYEEFKRRPQEWRK